MLKQTLLLALNLCCAIVPVNPAAAATTSTTTTAESPRQSADLSTGWRFRYGEAGDAPAAPAFDDSGWEQVSVPHSWNRIGEFGSTSIRLAAIQPMSSTSYDRFRVTPPA